MAATRSPGHDRREEKGHVEVTASAIRPMEAADADACGRVAFEAHQHVAALHHTPAEHPTVEFSIGMFTTKLRDPRCTGWVSERSGRVVGSVFLNAFTPTVAAIGPLTVLPACEGGVGRALMRKALEYASASGVDSVRLVQSPSHLRSLALYASLGFEVREPLAMTTGAVPEHGSPGAVTRQATGADIPDCDAVANRTTGVCRHSELQQAIARGTATVIERAGVVRGYSTGIGITGHIVADTTEELIALLSGTPRLPGPGFFLPLRNARLLQWALASGLRLGWPALLMTKGTYAPATGAYVPSIAF
jgi:ribosomal protein S18 acetylase RimI-like enzyme